MAKFIDLTGQRFGRLMVISRSPNRKNWRAMWLCQCDCGKKKIIRADNLRRGLTKSCGCLVGEWSKNNPPNKKYKLGLANMHALISKYKTGAKKRGLKFELTEERFEEITQRDCFYCGTKPNNVANIKSCNGSYTYNGIDRVDNNKGYIIDNVVTCCYICNRRKGKSNLQEYKDWIERSYNNIFKKGDD